MKKSFLRFPPLRLLGALALFLVWTVLGYGADINGTTPAEFTLTILHTNDVHGHLLPFSYASSFKGVESASVGGAARRATLIRRLRTERPDTTVLVDAGDLVQRGPLASEYEGIPDVESLNALGYDLATVGNNEFRLKDGRDHLDAAGAQAAFQRLVRSSRFPWISANLTDANGALLQGVQPFVVRKFGHVRVAFLGLTTPGTISAVQAKGLVALDPIAVATKWIPIARAEADVVILVSHLGLSLETKVVEGTSGIDAVVGGHSHTLLKEAVRAKNARGVEVPIVQTGEFGVNLGYFALHFARSANGPWHLDSFDYELLPVNADIPEAEDIKQLLEPYVAPLRKTVVTLPTFPNTAAEAYAFTLDRVMNAVLNSTRADVAVGGYGEGLFDRFQKAEISQYDLNAVLAIPHQLVTATLSGVDLIKLKKARPNTAFVGQNTDWIPAKNYRVAFFDTIAVNVYHLPESSLANTGIDAREAVLEFLRSPSGKPNEKD